MRILIIEDDKEAVYYLQQALQEAGLEVYAAFDAKSGYERAMKSNFDVLIIDRLLPMGDGLSLISKLRKNNIDTPILIVSALSTVEDKVKGLRCGGDDYLGKPYAFAELLARVEVLAVRKKQQASETLLKLGDLTLDRVVHKAWYNNNEIMLQPREFLLLEYLFRNAGQLVTRTMLLENVWNYHFDPQTNVVDVHISRLRTKMEQAGVPSLLTTVRGQGYILNASL
ncbi:response regulator transcription factor [Bartonella sp. TP]|uniref:response regulator transcription factor n=1 Tax=Bartonella sp. TP TaxID=3057550 RepID=UPI0025AF37AC|nr:response regulator transcription factor [Bartonella sp. TP]WJW80167.1 response regulator transcription factor [Bartonella sp. TP]